MLRKNSQNSLGQFSQKAHDTVPIKWLVEVDGKSKKNKKHERRYARAIVAKNVVSM
ncbi:MAG: hypothetical protein BMS9Abin19_1001 [Gammaproteobacteria bacterium]|nr:MAG: hypothetical protein BMS9Abin19_1001 [Gammaproteobacteria bacterium]